MPRVSILLTCYQHRAYIEAAVEGIRAQTYRDFEIIAIDDGSQDGTREWLAEQTDLRVILNEKNLGTYGTLNRALAEAQGEFVAVLNDDDVWMPEKLARQVQLFDANPKVALVHTGGRFIDGAGNVTTGNPLGFAFPRFETGDILLGLVYENKIIASAALARTAVIRELGGFDENYFGSGDWNMWFRVAEQHQVGYVSGELTDYRVHGTNASHKLERIWRDDERLRIWIAERLELLDAGRFPVGDVQKAKGFNYAALGTVQTLNGKPGEGRKSYLRSLRLDPTRWKSAARWAATFLGPKAFRRML
jgi:glycosyltransferase involved in cell wall biosynthesis